MPNEKQESFKQAAIGQGFSEDEVNSFMDTMNQMQPGGDPAQYEDVFFDSSNQEDSNVFFAGSENTYFQPNPDYASMGEEDFASYAKTLPYGVEDEELGMSRPMTREELDQMSSSILPMKARITQAFGNYNPRLEKHRGGVNLGTDFSVPMDTPLSVPPGKWVVVEASAGWNGGSGNYVKVQNTQTGDSIGYEHLNKIGVQVGQEIDSGTVIGLSGDSGNSTGPHASLPYQDASGQYQDILSSKYAGYLYGG